MSILVTGGAGYIGSNMVHALVDRGETVVVLDNLSTGYDAVLPEAARLVVGDIGDGIARTQEPVAFRSEYRHQRLFVFALEGGDEGIDRSFRRGEQPRLRNVRRILLVAGGQQAGKSRQ